jgi:FixJ family two-component response regulator
MARKLIEINVMSERAKRAFILDKDEFVRLSLSKILNKYGFEVEEIEDLSQLESRPKDVREGMILADLEIDVLEKWFPLLKKWGGRFILMSPQISNDVAPRLKKVGIHHILKKPVEPRLLRRVIQKISFPDSVTVSPSGRKRLSSVQ